MNWDAISAVAEIIGAIAVVASLVYLAIQIRQNTRQVEEQARGQRFMVLGALGDQWRGFRSNVVGNPETAGIWHRGNQNLESLSGEERAIFDLLMVEFFWGLAYNWIMGVEDGLGEYLRDELADNILVYDSPGLRDWWANTAHRNEYPSDFAKFVDGLMEQ